MLLGLRFGFTMSSYTRVQQDREEQSSLQNDITERLIIILIYPPKHTPKAQQLGRQFAVTVKTARFMKFPLNVPREFAS